MTAKQLLLVCFLFYAAGFASHYLVILLKKKESTEEMTKVTMERDSSIGASNYWHKQFLNEVGAGDDSSKMGQVDSLMSTIR